MAPTEKDGSVNHPEQNGERRDLLKATVAAVGATVAVAANSPSAMAQPADGLREARAREFLGSLYRDPPANMPASADLAFARLVARQGDTVVTGDQALQSLLMNYVVSNPTNADQGRRIAAALAGIKAAAVDAFTRTFPNTNLETLVSEAQRSGFEVQVLR